MSYLQSSSPFNSNIIYYTLFAQLRNKLNDNQLQPIYSLANKLRTLLTVLHEQKHANNLLECVKWNDFISTFLQHVI